MKLLDQTFATPEENLACDEALLDEAEEGPDVETLRFWEPATYFVVLGYSRPVHTEVHLDRCREERIPVLRRCSGGGSVLQGPGCLNYSLVLRIPGDGPLSTLTGTTSLIMDCHARALEGLLQRPVEVKGDSDLTMGERKFSGNAQRRRVRFLLFHGTFLINFDLERIGRFLAMPDRQPSYRGNRPHHQFVVNTGVPVEDLKRTLANLWNAAEGRRSPAEGIQRLVAGRYATPEWNFRR
jgi:lipoate---protein ligase